MKLIKINPEHYVIVDDSKIEEGDWCLMFDDYGNLFLGNQPQQYLGERAGHHLNKGLKKVTRSTQPLEIMYISGVTMTNPPKVFTNIKELSLQEVKELIGEVNVEKKAKQFENSFKEPDGTESEDFISGYNQCLEDNKDKKYTEEDMMKAWNAAFIDAMSIDKETYKPLFFEDFIQSLQPKTEWEVEFVDGKLKLKS